MSFSTTTVLTFTVTKHWYRYKSSSFIKISVFLLPVSRNFTVLRFIIIDCLHSRIFLRCSSLSAFKSLSILLHISQRYVHLSIRCKVLVCLEQIEQSSGVLLISAISSTWPHHIYRYISENRNYDMVNRFYWILYSRLYK